MNLETPRSRSSHDAGGRHEDADQRSEHGASVYACGDHQHVAARLCLCNMMRRATHWLKTVATGQAPCLFPCQIFYVSAGCYRF